MTKKFSFSDLVDIMTKLRGPGGCPWDHEQTHETLIPYLIEEAYEVIDAIERKNKKDLCEELGDLLLQVVFHAQVAKDENNFTIEDVVTSISEKMIRRHPHVFGDTNVSGSDEVVKNWEQIKKSEKDSQGKSGSLFDSVPRSLPALMQSYKLSKKASKVGFDWKHTGPVIEKIEEEVAELKEALANGDKTHIEHEVGDVFTSIANLCRFIKVEPELSLQKANNRFRERFKKMEEKIALRGHVMENLTEEQWTALWDEAKRELS